MSEWKAIEKEPKTVRAGFVRIYTFKPTEKNHPNDCVLSRCYRVGGRIFGLRKCDAFMDVPGYKGDTTDE